MKNKKYNKEENLEHLAVALYCYKAGFLSGRLEDKEFLSLIERFVDDAYWYLMIKNNKKQEEIPIQTDILGYFEFKPVKLSNKLSRLQVCAINDFKQAFEINFDQLISGKMSLNEVDQQALFMCYQAWMTTQLIKVSMICNGAEFDSKRQKHYAFKPTENYNEQYEAMSRKFAELFKKYGCDVQDYTKTEAWKKTNKPFELGDAVRLLFDHTEDTSSGKITCKKGTIAYVCDDEHPDCIFVDAKDENGDDELFTLDFDEVELVKKGNIRRN